MNARQSMTFRHVAPHPTLTSVHYTITAEQSDDGTWSVYGLAYGYATAFPVAYLAPEPYQSLEQATAYIETNAVTMLTARIGQVIERIAETPPSSVVIAKRKARYEHELSQAMMFD